MSTPERTAEIKKLREKLQNPDVTLDELQLLKDSLTVKELVEIADTAIGSFGTDQQQEQFATFVSLLNFLDSSGGVIGSINALTASLAQNPVD